jgi:anti-sigma-K factor RskA
MNYTDPQLRDRLAAEYALGTLPDRARARFDRLRQEDPSLTLLVDDWGARLAPLDETTPEQAPPARVWRGIERRLVLTAPAAGQRRFSWIRWWQGLGVAAAAAAATILISPLVSTPPLSRIVAVLNQNGEPAWIATAGPRSGEVGIAAIRSFPDDPAHSFELWGIAGGPPRPLGLLHRQAGRALVLEATKIPAAGGVLAVSIEPPEGSPTGQPTGPVVSQGKVLDGTAPQ